MFENTIQSNSFDFNGRFTSLDEYNFPIQQTPTPEQLIDPIDPFLFNGIDANAIFNLSDDWLTGYENDFGEAHGGQVANGGAQNAAAAVPTNASSLGAAAIPNPWASTQDVGIFGEVYNGQSVNGSIQNAPAVIPTNAGGVRKAPNAFGALSPVEDWMNFYSNPLYAAPVPAAPAPVPASATIPVPAPVPAAASSLKIAHPRPSAPLLLGDLFPTGPTALANPVPVQAPVVSSSATSLGKRKAVDEHPHRQPPAQRMLADAQAIPMPFSAAPQPQALPTNQPFNLMLPRHQRLGQGVQAAFPKDMAPALQPMVGPNQVYVQSPLRQHWTGLHQQWVEQPQDVNNVLGPLNNTSDSDTRVISTPTHPQPPRTSAPQPTPAAPTVEAAERETAPARSRSRKSKKGKKERAPKVPKEKVIPEYMRTGPIDPPARVPHTGWTSSTTITAKVDPAHLGVSLNKLEVGAALRAATRPCNWVSPATDGSTQSMRCVEQLSFASQSLAQQHFLRHHISEEFHVSELQKKNQRNKAETEAREKARKAAEEGFASTAKAVEGESASTKGAAEVQSKSKSNAEDEKFQGKCLVHGCGREDFKSYDEFLDHITKGVAHLSTPGTRNLSIKCNDCGAVFEGAHLGNYENSHWCFGKKAGKTFKILDTGNSTH